MRALTGYDRVTLSCGDRRAESSRGSFAAPSDAGGLPVLIADSEVDGVPVFPRVTEEASLDSALMRAPEQEGARSA